MDWTNNHIEPGESHVFEMEGEEQEQQEQKQEQQNEAEAEYDVSEEPVDEVYTLLKIFNCHDMEVAGDLSFSFNRCVSQLLLEAET